MRVSTWTPTSWIGTTLTSPEILSQVAPRGDPSRRVEWREGGTDLSTNMNSNHRFVIPHNYKTNKNQLLEVT